VFFGALDLATILGVNVGAGPVQCMLFAYAGAFRWALMDQRRRCQECLRLLAYPAPIRRPSHTLFEWYGTEFACPKGHGLLHVPDTMAISCRTQRWLRLDRS